MVSLSEKLKSAIEEYAQEQNITIQDGYKVSRASLNGDSFGADVLRISIPVTRKDENGNDAPEEGGDNAQPLREVRLIAKAAPKLKFRREMYSIPILFEREKFMYTTLLPDFEAFQLKHLRPPGGPIFDNYPQLIKSSADEFDEFMLLSDICEEGYKNFNRTQGASFALCQEILRRFAKLHAISFVYQAVDRKRFNALVGNNLRETLFVEDLPESFETFLRNKIALVEEKLNEKPQAGDQLVHDRLNEFRNSCGREMFNVCHVRDYAVVCHGDSWISNFMFKSNAANELVDIKFIDFQVSRFTTPVVDLSYFLACSTDKELRRRLPELLNYYHNRLMEEIRLLGHSSPELLYPCEVYADHCKKYMKFGFGMAMMSLHSITCEPGDMPDVIQLLETSSFQKIDEITQTLIGNPAYCLRITDLVRDMVEFGYL